jgi:tetratricopeptide (TPR) repeat protein
VAETPATSGGGGPGDNPRRARWLPVGVLIALALTGGAVLAWHQLQTNKELPLLGYRAFLFVCEQLAKVEPGLQGAVSVAHEWVGDELRDQGKLDEALVSYLASLAIRERLANAQPSNTRWQSDVSVAQNRIGDVLHNQGKLDEALASYLASLAIRERLAAAEPSNTRWLSDLSSSHSRIGSVLVSQGKFAEALTSSRDSLVIAERRARADPSNAERQWDVVVSHWNLAMQGDDPARRWVFIVAELRALKDEHRLRPEWAGFLPVAEKELAKVREAQAAPQRAPTPP